MIYLCLMFFICVLEFFFIGSKCKKNGGKKIFFKYNDIKSCFEDW